MHTESILSFLDDSKIQANNNIDFQTRKTLLKKFKIEYKLDELNKEYKDVLVLHVSVINKCLDPILVLNNKTVAELNKNQDLVIDYNETTNLNILNKLIRDQQQIANLKLDESEKHQVILDLTKLVSLMTRFFFASCDLAEINQDTKKSIKDNQESITEWLCFNSELFKDNHFLLIQIMKLQNLILKSHSRNEEIIKQIIQYQSLLLKKIEEDSVAPFNEIEAFLNSHYKYLSDFVEIKYDENDLYNKLLEHFDFIAKEIEKLNVNNDDDAKIIIDFHGLFLKVLHLDYKNKAKYTNRIVDSQQSLLKKTTENEMPKTITALLEQQKLMFNLTNLDFYRGFLDETYASIIENQDKVLASENILEYSEISDIIKNERMILMNLDPLQKEKILKKIDAFYKLISKSQNKEIIKNHIEFLDNFLSKEMKENKKLFEKVINYNSNLIEFILPVKDENSKELKQISIFEEIVNYQKSYLENIDLCLFNRDIENILITHNHILSLKNIEIKGEILQNIAQAEMSILESIDSKRNNTFIQKLIENQPLLIEKFKSISNLSNFASNSLEYIKNLTDQLDINGLIDFNNKHCKDFFRQAIRFQKEVIKLNKHENDLLELVMSQQYAVLNLVHTAKLISKKDYNKDDKEDEEKEDDDEEKDEENEEFDQDEEKEKEDDDEEKDEEKLEKEKKKFLKILTRHQGFIIKTIDENINFNLVDKRIVDKIMEYQNLVLSNWGFLKILNKKNVKKTIKALLNSHKNILACLDKQIDAELIKKVFENQGLLVDFIHNNHNNINEVFNTFKDCKSLVNENLLRIDVPQELVKDAGEIYDNLSEITKTISPLFDINSFNDLKKKVVSIFKNKRFFKVALYKAFKLMIDLSLFIVALFFNQTSYFDYYFGYVYYVYLYAYLLTSSIRSINNFLVFYNTSFNQEVGFLLSLESLKNVSDRTEGYGNVFKKLLFIPNEILYSITYFITKYGNVFYFRELMWRFNYNFINIMIFIFESALILCAIAVNGLAIYYVKTINNKDIGLIYIFCIILLVIKLQLKSVEFFYLKIVTPIKFFETGKNFSKNFARFMRHEEHLIEGCVFKEDCNSFNLEHIVNCHSELRYKKKSHPDIKKFFCAKSLNEHVVGFYPVTYEEAFNISKNGFTLQNREFGNGVYFSRSIENCIKSNSILANHLFIVALVNLGKKQVINYEQAKMKIKEKKRFMHHLKVYRFDSLFIKASETNSEIQEKEQFVVFDKEKIVKFVVCLNDKMFSNTQGKENA